MAPCLQLPFPDSDMVEDDDNDGNEEDYELVPQLVAKKNKKCGYLAALAAVAAMGDEDSDNSNDGNSPTQPIAAKGVIV